MIYTHKVQRYFENQVNSNKGKLLSTYISWFASQTVYKPRQTDNTKLI